MSPDILFAVGSLPKPQRKKFPIENIQRLPRQRSSGVVLNYFAAATIDDGPPLLQIIT